MDKYEYKLKLDQMKSLTAENDYKTAAEIAETINWHKVKNVNELIKAGEIYDKVGRYEESREILLMAYDRSPIGRMIIYHLAEIAIKMGNFDEAKDYYQEFVEIAPHDNLKYVLKYRICQAEGADIKTLIVILEELKEQEYSEEWAYELAYMYHKAGMSEKCIEACDELILWFGDGPYVERALELKMLYQPLNRQQEEKYRQFRLRKEGIVEVTPEDQLESGEYVREAVQIPKVNMSSERFNTQNLQEELQKSMQQIMDATERGTVNDSMDNIKKLVEEIPYLQLPREENTLEEELSQPHIETDAEIDDSLKINFHELLAEDRDGQISLFVPENGNQEPQITGQMSIEEVLAEWEKTKRAAEAALQEAEQRKLESAKAKALQEAGDIMERLADVIPKLDSGLTPKELLEEQYLAGEPIEEGRAAEMVANMNQILQQEIDRLSTENAQMDEQIAAAGMAAAASEAKEQIEEQPVAVALSGVTELVSEEQPAGEYETDEMDDMLTDMPIPEVPVNVEELSAETQEVSAEEAFIVDSVSQIQEQPLEEQLAEEQPSEELPSVELPSEELLSEEPVQSFDMEDAILNEAAKMMKQESEAAAKEVLPEIAEPEEVIKVSDRPAITKLSKEQREIFSYFVPIKGMEEQLCQAMTGAVAHLSSGKTGATGNMIIQGNQGSGKTVLATDMVKAIQKECGKPNGRIGKIDATVLNQKDVAELLRKVAGGCLIIEKAGNISKETAAKLGLLLASDTSGLLVIIEDTHKGIEKALGKDKGFAARFSEKISIPIFTSDELVIFAKAYANELGYTIDEMGVLALYNSISNIQKLDRATTLIEVKEIVDGAIARAEKGGLKKAFGILMSRRYDENDYVILYEKDFGF